MFLDVAPNLLGMGLSVAALVARNVDNTRTTPEQIAYRRAVGRRLAAFWKNRSITAHPATREYHRLHEQFGAVGEPPAPEKLVTYVRRHRDFTASGAVVDCYNIVSARTLLSIGAHDLEKLATPVTLRLTTPADLFVPLGETAPRPLSEEYAYVDSQGSIICRLDVLQCEQTKTTRESRDIAFFLQGNRCLPASILLKGAWLLSEMVTRFCGGTVELVGFFDALPTLRAAAMKPQISVETFQRLSLRTGTILRSSPLPNLTALSAVTLRTDSEVKALAPSSALTEWEVGQKAVVATGLHPLVIAGETYTAYVPTLHSESAAAPLHVADYIPEGARLY